MTPVRHANCLVWLIAARERLPGCYIMIRRSKGGPYPHFLIRTRSRYPHIISFVPAWADPYAQPTPWWKVGIFQGHMVWGDHAELPYVRQPRRYHLVRAFFIVGLGGVLFLAWLAWWVSRVLWWLWWAFMILWADL